MTHFKKSVNEKQKYGEGWLGVSPIESKKRDTPLVTHSKTLLYAAFMMLIKKFSSLFSNRSVDPLLSEQPIIEGLLSFRKMLQILSNEDQSHNPEFTQQLSEVWHHLLNSDSSALPELTLFIKRIQTYPPSSDHALGFYLTAYAGREWLPFPFMEILHQLYKEHQVDDHESTLNNWILHLNRIISTLNPLVDLNSF